MLKRGGGAAPGVGQELHERLAALGPEPRELAVALQPAQADHALVELRQRIEVRHPQADRADGCAGGNHVTASSASLSVRKNPKKTILAACTRAPSQ